MSRIKQVYMNLTDKMKDEDYNLVESILNEQELKLFNMLSKSEQKHSVRVYKNMEASLNNKFKDNKYLNQYRDVLLKASLLHDIGKSKAKTSVLDKCVLVLFNKITNGNLRKVNNKKVQCYYNHPEYSYEILDPIIDDELLLYIIRNHHNNVDNVLIEHFKRMDDLS